MQSLVYTGIIVRDVGGRSYITFVSPQHILPPITCLWGCLKVVRHWRILSGKSYSRRPDFVSSLMTPSSAHPVKSFYILSSRSQRLLSFTSSLWPPVVQFKKDVSCAVLLCFIPPPNTVSFSTHTVKEPGCSWHSWWVQIEWLRGC